MLINIHNFGIVSEVSKGMNATLSISVRIRELREDSDYKQREIASLLNCSQVSYSNYEIGKRCIPLECVVKLAEFYNVSTDYLLGVTDRKERYPQDSVYSLYEKY